MEQEVMGITPHLPKEDIMEVDLQVTVAEGTPHQILLILVMVITCQSMKNLRSLT